MERMVDRFGREISVDDTGQQFSVEGITVIADSWDEALNTLNAMAPEGYQEVLN